MTVFSSYSKYYDLLYMHKDYEGECSFVLGLLQKHAVDVRSFLDLGCGTGRHAAILAQRGFRAVGVDRSETMLDEAERRRELLVDVPNASLSFHVGDIRCVRLEEKFDVVLALFHVMSYMTENQDLKQAVATARSHLNPGGLFLFDFWYGPAVLTDPPVVRVKRLGDETAELLRIAEPILHPNDNCVDVCYDVRIVDRKTRKTEIITECHHMRYIFLPEVKELLHANGMTPVFFCEWMTGKEPGLSTWNVIAGARVTPR